MGVCRARALIPAPVARVWEYIVEPRNMPRWVPYIESVAGVDRPLQTGDRLTLRRRDFFIRRTRELLVEEVLPYHSFRLRVLTATGRRTDVTARVSVEPAADAGATWIEEAIDYSLGKGPLARRVERWLLDPLFRVLVQRKSGRALRCLAERLAPGAGARQEAEPGTVTDRGDV